MELKFLQLLAPDWHAVLSHLATRCLCLGVYLTQGQPDPKSDQMSTWPKVVSFLATRCLWQGVHLAKCRKVIWKFEHTTRFCSCFTEVFSYERPISKQSVIKHIFWIYINILWYWGLFTTYFKKEIYPELNLVCISKKLLETISRLFGSTGRTIWHTSKN